MREGVQPGLPQVPPGSGAGPSCLPACLGASSTCTSDSCGTLAKSLLLTGRCSTLVIFQGKCEEKVTCEESGTRPPQCPCVPTLCPDRRRSPLLWELTLASHSKQARTSELCSRWLQPGLSPRWAAAPETGAPRQRGPGAEVLEVSVHSRGLVCVRRGRSTETL